MTYRRHRNLISKNLKLTQESTNPEILYIKYRALFWLRNLLKYNIKYDSNFFIYFDWCTNELSIFLEKIRPQIKKIKSPNNRRNTLFEDFQEILGEGESQLIFELERFIDKNPKVKDLFISEMIVFCDMTLNKFNNSSINNKKHFFIEARHKMQDMFGLSNEAYNLCEFIFINQSMEVVENYLEDILHIHKYGNRQILSSMLAIPEHILTKSINYLGSCGFIDNDTNIILRLDDSILNFWNDIKTNISKNSSIEKVNSENLFFKPIDNYALPLEAFTSVNGKTHGVLGENGEEKIAHVCNLLSKNTEEPIHILLYGYAGTGKTTFAKSLAKHLGIKAWSVTSRTEDRESTRRTSLVASLHLARQHKNAFVLVDEAENLLDTEIRRRDSKDKAWLNSFLEQKNTRIIWITNHVEHIDNAVRRRFSYSLFFDKLGKEERTLMWQKILKDKKLTNKLKHVQIEALAEEYTIPLAIIEQAINTVKEHYNTKDKFEKGLRLCIDSYISLENNGKKKKKKLEANNDYTLDGVNLGSCSYELIEKCKKVAKQDNKELPAGFATMLFYGAPGTGKTALARYIAKSINKTCIVKKASDLLSKYVGENEENIANAFKEAEEKNAVLIIDEADSFLFSRENANHSWEASMVNEFLTNLEECRSFCICTTNRREHLDPACMRRFSYKLEFKYSTQKQVLALYKALLAPLCNDKLTSAMQNTLKSFTRLAPGDFHAVKSQFNNLFVDTNNISHNELIHALQLEENLKLDAKEKKMGF